MSPFCWSKITAEVFRTKGELKTITQKRHKARAEGVYSAFLEVQYSAPIKSPIGVRGGGGDDANQNLLLPPVYRHITARRNCVL